MPSEDMRAACKEIADDLEDAGVPCFVWAGSGIYVLTITDQCNPDLIENRKSFRGFNIGWYEYPNINEIKSYADQVRRMFPNFPYHRRF